MRFLLPLLAAMLLVVQFTAACPPVVGNCYIFPPTSEWNRPIDTNPVDYMSPCVMQTVATWLTSNEITDGYNVSQLRINFGLYVSQGYGMPWIVTDGEAPLVPMNYTAYQDQSDWYNQAQDFMDGNSPPPWGQAYFPFPQDMPIEGWGGNVSTDPTTGDRHAIALDSVNCMLYESFATTRLEVGFEVANTAIWNLSLGDLQRPAGWTSACAAGTAIYPGILKYAEIASGEITHALGFTIAFPQNAYSDPGRHSGTSYDFPNYPYFGARFRLRANFSTNGYANDTAVVIRALQKYGLILLLTGGSNSAPSVIADTDSRYGINIDPELNHNNRIPFDVEHWDMVQSIGPVVYGYTPSPSPPTCDGISQNPTWSPNFNPSCPGPKKNSSRGSHLTPAIKSILPYLASVLTLFSC